MVENAQRGANSKSASRSRLPLLGGLLVLLLAVAGGRVAWRNWQAAQDAKLQQMSLPELETRVKNRPDDGNARYRLGLAYAKENNYSEAVKTLLAVLEQQKEPNAQTADILNDLGVIYLLQERYYESLVALKQALELRPNFGAAYANLGRLHLATKMPFTATKELQKAAELEPNNVNTLCDLGEAHQQTLNHDAALEAYGKALKVDPQSVAAHLGSGRVLYSKGKYEPATQALQTALKYAPDSASALLTLGRMSIEQARTPDDLQKAAGFVEKGLKADPQNPDGWYDLGKIALKQSKPKDAIEHLKKALTYSPQHNGALHQIERALRADGRIAEADRTKDVLQARLLREREELRLEEHVEHNQQDWEAQAKLAEIYLLNNKRGLAMLLIEKLKNNDPNNPKLPQLTQMLGGQTATGARQP